MTMTHVESGKMGKARGGRINKLAGFYVDRIDAEVMREYVELRGLKIDVDVTAEQLAVALSQHFADLPEEKKVQCTKCLAVASEEETRCPFCGDEGEEEEVPQAKPESSVETKSVADESTPEEEDESEVGEEEIAEKEEEGKGAMMHDAQVNGSSAKNGKNGRNGKKSMALTVPVPVEGRLTIGDVRAQVARIKKYQADGFAAYWKFATELRDMKESVRWKLLKDEEGKEYRSFEQFVHHELGMTPAHAYAAIKNAEEYSSAEEISGVGGPTKAALIVKAAPQDQEKIKEKAKAGASTNEIRKDVAISRKKHGASNQSQQAKAGAVGKASQEKAKAVEKITVASITGSSRTVKMFAKQATRKNVAWPPEKRAKTLKDVPTARLELQPGVVLWIAITQKEDGLVANVQFVRE